MPLLPTSLLLMFFERLTDFSVWHTCHQNFHIKDPCAKQWLLSHCTAIGSSADRPTVLPYESMHIGNRIAHHTHRLMIYRGLVYCNKCGCIGTNQLRKLGGPCLPPTATYGIPNLRMLHDGILPTDKRGKHKSA